MHAFCISLTIGCSTVSHPLAQASRQSRGVIPTEDGLELSFVVEGDAPDTVVALHGGPGLSAESLRPDLLELAESFTIIFYDQRGSGLSTPVPDSSRISIAHHVADLEAVRRYFGLDRLVLLGHSWGGGLALHYASTHPRRTERLLLVDPMPLRRDPHMAEFGRRLQSWMDRATMREVNAAGSARFSSSDPFGACRAYWTRFIRGYLAHPYADVSIRGDMCYGSTATVNNRVYRFTLGTVGAWDWLETARGIVLPVLITFGDRSPLPRESFDEWASALPDVEMVAIVGAGHFPHAERPSEFIAAAIPFLHGE